MKPMERRRSGIEHPCAVMEDDHDMDMMAGALYDFNGKELHDGDDGDDGDNGDDDDDDIMSNASLASTGSKLPRCAVVNFRKEGDCVSMRPRVTTDTGETFRIDCVPRSLDVGDSSTG
jgi:hypothetical protein